MLRSLRARLLVVTLVVAGLAVAVTGVIASRSTDREFRSYVERLDDETEFAADELDAVLLEGAPISDTQPLAEDLADEIGGRIVLATDAGTILADSDRDPGSVPPLEGLLGAATWDVDGEGVTLYVLEGDSLGSAGEGFLGSVNRAVLVGALVAGAAAIVLALVLSQRLARPVHELTRAARRVEAGTLDERVDARGRGEIGELARAFNAMAEGLEQSEATRRAMVSDVAHELRTPLANVVGYLEAMRDGVTEPTPEHLGSVHEEAVQLGRLVDDLQELALADAGRLSLHCQRVNLRDLVAVAVAAAGPGAETDGVTLVAEGGDEPLPVSADAERIGQVLRNLLGNAVRHAPSGSTVTVRAGRDGSEVALAVVDRGEGLTPDQQDRVFERFYRVDEARTRGAGGSGLGLAIAKRLVEAHGGTVWVESAPGAGATFGFSLPLAA